MNTQPEALRLADELADPYDGMWFEDPRKKAAAELRRLHEENQKLRQALAQPEQEPVDWEAVAADQAMTIAMMKIESKQPEGKPIAFLSEAHNEDGDSLGYVAHTNFVYNSFPVYTLPPAWQGLTNEQVYEHEWWDEETAYAVNKFLMEKNNG